MQCYTPLHRRFYLGGSVVPPPTLLFRHIVLSVFIGYISVVSIVDASGYCGGNLFANISCVYIYEYPPPYGGFSHSLSSFGVSCSLLSIIIKLHSHEEVVIVGQISASHICPPLYELGCLKKKYRILSQVLHLYRHRLFE